MQREILFRAWHKTSNAMYSMGWNQRPNAEVFVTIEQLFDYGEDAEIMQFTGLTDKNGINIFEGDIVSDGVYQMEIVWDNSYSSFCLDRNGWAFRHYFKEGCDPNKVEVIGNIYENPELLK